MSTFFRNPIAFSLLSMAVAAVLALVFLMAFGDSLYSGLGLRWSKWAAGTISQYTLAFGLAVLLGEEGRKMTVRNSLYLIIALTLASPGTLAQFAFIAWILTTPA